MMHTLVDVVAFHSTPGFRRLPSLLRFRWKPETGRREAQDTHQQWHQVMRDPTNHNQWQPHACNRMGGHSPGTACILIVISLT